MCLNILIIDATVFNNITIKNILEDDEIYNNVKIEDIEDDLSDAEPGRSSQAFMQSNFIFFNL